MTSSNTLPESSNTLMQRLHSIKSRIVESVTEHEIPTELEKEESYIPVRAWYCYIFPEWRLKRHLPQELST